MPAINQCVVIFASCLVAVSRLASFPGAGEMSQQTREAAPGYLGRPYADSVYHGGPQSVPGRVQCEYYDLGGEGVAFHDSDAHNSGSGDLNPDDGSYLNTFRMNEAVDISYTKFWDEIDNSQFNLVMPEPSQLYLGWTAEGEWVNYTLTVVAAGQYDVGLMYTSNGDNQIALAIDGEPVAGPMTMPTTNDPEDPHDWRQWHHWNKIERLTTLTLSSGIHVLTLKIGNGGNMNFDYIELTLPDTPPEESVVRAQGRALERQ